MRKKTSKLQPLFENQAHLKTQESIQQNLSLAEKQLPEIKDIITSSRPGPQGINRWMWENKVQHEIPNGLLREYLSRGMRNAPHVYYRKYQVVRMMLLHIAKYHEISPAMIIKDLSDQSMCSKT